MDSRRLRSSNNYLNILSKSPGNEHLEITGSRLPTYEQVLLCFLSTKEKLNHEGENLMSLKNNNRKIAKMVVSQVILHYQRAGIPTKAENKMTEDIVKLRSDFTLALKTKTEAVKNNFKNKLSKTMPFWSMRVIKNMEASLKSTRVSEVDFIWFSSATLNQCMHNVC